MSNSLDANAALEAAPDGFSFNSCQVPEVLTPTLQSHHTRRSAGTTLKLEGDEAPAIFVVLSGWLALAKTLPDGDKQIMDFVLAGDIIDPASADPLASAVAVEALTDVSLSIVLRETWGRLLSLYPGMRIAHERTAAAAKARISERILRLGKASAEVRIAYALIELCVRLDNVKCGDGAQFHLPLTQKQLGDFTGLSSVHVCRTLRRLKRHGIVETSDQMNVVIRDMDALAAAAKADPVELRRLIIPAH
jgi:CRP-like cAMP-binding protein